ncbi:MAG: glycosyltransferase [Humidesulfovibrio sp.]|nr:glycosyltransferase [Humidesulfovibrio sp.]
MRIAFVNATRKWGGVKTWCLDMASALEAQGHAAWIFGRRGEFVAKASRLGLRARGVWFGFDFNPFCVFYFLYFFLTRRVDVVVVNVAKDLRTAGLAARLLGRQIVQHVGSGGDFDDIRMVRLVQRLLRPRLLCCSDYVRERILIHVPSMRGQEVHALHPGVRVPESPSFAAHTPPVVIATSQLNADKHHADLLLALARLKAAGVPFRAVIAGTGSLAAELKAQATALGLDDRLEWTGFTVDVQGVLRGGDVFVLPTLVEPLGIALEEAMAAGLAPVARAAGGVPEIWPEACRAYLTPPADGPEGLEKALRLLLALPWEERQAVRRAAWEHARARFNLPDQAARFARWMAQALPRPKHS